MDQSLIFFLSFILIIGSVFFVIIARGKKCNKKLDVEHYRAKCLEYEHQLKQGDLDSYHTSIMNGDKLVDKALKERGFKGDTMGERLRNASSSFNNPNLVWTAHKMRNKIAHELDFNPTYNESKLAMAGFRKALKDLGAI